MRVSSDSLHELLRSKFGGKIQKSSIELGDVVIWLKREDLVDVFRLLKLDSQLSFDFFVSVTVTDWMDLKSERYEVVYHLLSTSKLHRLRIKIPIPERDPSIDSVVQLWSGANFMEREAYDMYGVIFKGHPDLRRILMYDEFEGYPLRKDYPVQGKQPRIPLISPEVRNTAVDMVRPELVQIRRKKNVEKKSGEGRAA